MWWNHPSERVDIEEQFAYKTQFRGLEWNERELVIKMRPMFHLKSVQSKMSLKRVSISDAVTWIDIFRQKQIENRNS